MKFRDPKTGEVFEDIHQAKDVYCMGKDCVGSCALMSNAMLCYQWVEDYPVEAARRMGFEVVEESFAERPEVSVRKEATMEKTDDLLCGYCDKTDGLLYTTYPPQVKCTATGEYYRLGDRCNLPETGGTQDGKPRFTEEEVADARVLARALLADGFERDKGGDVFATSSVACRTLLDSNMFPSLRPGQAVKLEEIIGAAP